MSNEARDRTERGGGQRLRGSKIKQKGSPTDSQKAKTSFLTFWTFSSNL